MPKVPRELIDEVTKKYMDQGLIIEAGWQTLKMMSVSPGAPQIQIDEMRNAFFAGAQHLFASIMSALDPGLEETEDDMRRLNLISIELEQFYTEFKKKYGV